MINIHLTPELENLIQHKVATGMYTNASEVIRDALRHFDDKDPYKELQDMFVPREPMEQEKFLQESFDNMIAEAKHKRNVFD